MNQKQLDFLVAVCYASVQLFIALLVSVVGAVHVYRCMVEEKKSVQIQTSVELNTTQQSQPTSTDTVAVTVDAMPNEPQIEVVRPKKRDNFLALWAKTMWKMKGIYSGLAVHSFDVLTDVLVIITWLYAEDIDGDNINPQIMAYCAIFVFGFSKIISAIAIYMVDRSILRAVLQLFDLLIFVEIYEAHKKIVRQLKSKKLEEQNAAIESTLSFKYIRMFEAVFESIPESVLQLVYAMRIKDRIPWIFAVSIVQSVISMTNSILNNDNTQMKDPEFKEYKKRFPPSWKFMKHAISRLSEIMYRIGLLALLWSVCGGLPFGIVIGVDVLLIAGRAALLMVFGEETLNGDFVLLNMNSLIVTPSEHVYAEDFEWYAVCAPDDVEGCFIRLLLNCFCCACLAACLTACGRIIVDRKCETQIGLVPTVRIGVSLMEFLFLIFYGIFGQNGERKKFLFSDEHGLYVFITTCVSFGIYSQYRLLFPDFRLPFGINPRSKWGYAYSNELIELQKTKVPHSKMPYTIVVPAVDRSGYPRDKMFAKEYEVSNEATFWDQPYLHVQDESGPVTAAMLAMKQGHADIVEWLEERGATRHREDDLQVIKTRIEIGVRKKFKNEI